MPNPFADEIKQHLLQLRIRNNAYVFNALRLFAEQQLLEIAALCYQHHFGNDIVMSIQHEYITELEKINYLSGYSRREIKTIHRDAFEVDGVSLAKYIYQKEPDLKNIEYFVHEKLGKLTNDKQELLDKIITAKALINRYSRANKMHLVIEFNTQAERIYSKLHDNPYHVAVEDIQQEMKQLLEKLQTDENKYYHHFRFFAQRRKDNSTLQKHLDAAKSMFANPSA